MTTEHLESLRLSFKPTRVRVLLVGESPPAGGTFFYLANSTLYTYTRGAFARVYGPVAFGPGGTASGFLEFFQQRGFYLDDLCLEPVNHMAPTERRVTCSASAQGFASRLAALKPDALVAVKMTLDKDIRAAMALASVADLPLYVLPHPACGNQKRYVNGLIECLRVLDI